MKYLYSTAVFLAFIMVITRVVDFNYKQENENIDLSDTKIENVVVNLQDANLTISTTVDKDIKIENFYSEVANPTSNLYSFQNGKTLYINEYPYNKTNLITKKEIVNVYLPETHDFNKIDITTTTGRVNVDGVSLQKLNVNTTKGKVDIGNLTTDKLNIKGDQFGVTISNSFTKVINATISQVQFNINNTIADKLIVTTENDSTVNVNKLVADKVVLDGEKTAVNLLLSEGLDYDFQTPLELKNEQLEQTSTGYKFSTNTDKPIVKYQMENVASVKIEFEKQQEVK